MTETVKNPIAMRDTWVRSLGWEDPLEKELQPTGEFHGQRSLAGCSPWSPKELDTSEQLSLPIAN